MAKIFTRREWTGAYEKLGELWTMTKGRRAATALVVTHPLGVELRLVVDDELLQSQAHRDDDQLLDQSNNWKTAMQAKGWV